MTDVSITDIARRAGVSPSTVSRALAGHPRISAERCREIQALAREMGYHPSQVARSLVTGKSRTLGVVCTDLTDPFVAEVMKGAEAEAREAGYGLLFAMSNRDPEQEVAVVQMLLDRQVDGVIVISSRASGRLVGETTLSEGRAVPLVLINQGQPNERTLGVRMNNIAGARAAVAYLYGLGHCSVAFVCGPDGGCSSRERLEGYRQAVAKAGYGYRPELVQPSSGCPEDGPRALESFLRLADPPTAVVCYNDLVAIGLLAAAARAGLAVPGDLSVVGYDNIPLSAYTVPPLTTVDQPKRALGRRSVAMCLARLAGQAAADEVLDGTLVIRESAGPPGRGRH